MITQAVRLAAILAIAGLAIVALAVELARIAGSLPIARRSLLRRSLPLFVSTAGPAAAAISGRHPAGG